MLYVPPVITFEGLLSYNITSYTMLHPPHLNMQPFTYIYLVEVILILCGALVSFLNSCFNVSTPADVTVPAENESFKPQLTMVQR